MNEKKKFVEPIVEIVNFYVDNVATDNELSSLGLTKEWTWGKGDGGGSW